MWLDQPTGKSDGLITHRTKKIKYGFASWHKMLSLFALKKTATDKTILKIFMVILHNIHEHILPVDQALRKILFKILNIKSKPETNFLEALSVW